MIPRDVAEQLPGIAARMHRIAHLPENHILVRKGDNLSGVDIPEEVDDEENPGQKKTVTRHYPRPGIVPCGDALEPHRRPRPDPVTGETRGPAPLWVDVPDLTEYLVHRYKLVENDTRVTLIYTVDEVDERVVRHFTIQLTVLGKIAQGELLAAQGGLLEALAPLVGVFLPAARLGVGVGTSARAGAPWPVVDGAMPVQLRAQGWKTPVVFDFVMDHDLKEPDAAPKTKARLYGPDGSLL